MALNVYDVEVRHGAVALRTAWLGFTVVKVHSLCECVDAKNLTNKQAQSVSNGCNSLRRQTASNFLMA